jgi:hypothetical protein
MRGSVQRRGRRLTASLLAIGGFAAGACAVAQEPQNAEQPAAAVQPVPAFPKGVRRGLVICGLSGDADHHRAFSQTVEKLHRGLVAQVGFEPANLKVLFGDEPDDQDPPLIRESGRSTREKIAEAIEQFRTASKLDDGVWIVLIGHAHFDGKDCWLNLPGPDYSQNEFAKLVEGFTAGEQVILATIPVSGQWIKPTSKQGRVVITATQMGWETNETEFASTLATLLEKPPEGPESDVDQDGRQTLFDLYIRTCRHLAQSYVERELLATEHPLLDDNGDGRGTELQADYLSLELGGRVRRTRTAQLPKVMPGTDGSLARSILLKKNDVPTRP